MIEMDCPHCGHHLRINDKYAGRKGGCVHCKGRFQLPDAPPPGAAGIETPVADDPPPQPEETVAANPGPGDTFAPRSLSSLQRMDIDGGADLPPDLGMPDAGDPEQGEGSLGKVAPGDTFKPRSISSLQRMDIDGGDGLSPAFAKAQVESREKAIAAAYGPEGLGCLFWGLACFIPPVALVWAFTLPKDHHSKKRALGVSGGFLLLAVALIVVAVLVA